MAITSSPLHRAPGLGRTFRAWATGIAWTWPGLGACPPPRPSWPGLGPGHPPSGLAFTGPGWDWPGTGLAFIWPGLVWHRATGTVACPTPPGTPTSATGRPDPHRLRLAFAAWAFAPGLAWTGPGLAIGLPGTGHRLPAWPGLWPYHLAWGLDLRRPLGPAPSWIARPCPDNTFWPLTPL